MVERARSNSRFFLYSFKGPWMGTLFRTPTDSWSKSLMEVHERLLPSMDSSSSVFRRLLLMAISNSSSRSDLDRMREYGLGFLNFLGVVERFSNTSFSCSSWGKRAATVDLHLRCRTICNHCGSLGVSPSSITGLKCVIHSPSFLMGTYGLLTPGCFAGSLCCHWAFNDRTDSTWPSSTPLSSSGASTSSNVFTTPFRGSCSSASSSLAVGRGGHCLARWWGVGCSSECGTTLLFPVAEVR